MSQSGQQPQQSNGAATGAPPPHTNKGIVKQVSIKFKLILNRVVSGLFNIHTLFPVDDLSDLATFHFQPPPPLVASSSVFPREIPGTRLPLPPPQNTNLIPLFSILTSSFPCPFAFSPLPPSLLSLSQLRQDHAPLWNSSSTACRFLRAVAFCLACSWALVIWSKASSLSSTITCSSLCTVSNSCWVCSLHMYKYMHVHVHVHVGYIAHKEKHVYHSYLAYCCFGYVFSRQNSKLGVHKQKDWKYSFLQLYRYGGNPLIWTSITGQAVTCIHYTQVQGI